MKSGWFDREEKPFNMAQLLLERINKRFEEANEARVEGDIFKWFRCLGAIKSSIYFKIVSDNDNEKIKVDDLMKTAEFNAKRAIENKQEIFFFTAHKSLVELEEYLIVLAYRYELYYPHYESKGWEEKAMEEDI